MKTRTVVLVIVLAGGAVAAIVVAAVMAIFAVFYFTGGIVETADAFFHEVAAGDVDGAWDYVSSDFKASTTRGEFEAFLTESSLSEYQSATWSNRQVTTDSGFLEGAVVTPSGRIPIKISFVKGPDGWKIQRIEKEPSGIAKPSDVSLPTLAESADLVKATTRDFAAAVNQKDFADFHAGVSAELQEQATPEEFAEVFATFLDQEIDLSVLEGMEPLFTTAPAMAADGTLHLEGYFASTPSRTYFSYTYIKQPEGWKLLGINVNVRPVEK